MDDTWLMIVIAFFAVFGGIGISTAFYVQRVDEIRKQCAKRVAMANDEVTTLRDMQRRTLAQWRILSSTPVSRLIGDNDE